jgi:hypothetical protein
MQSATLKPPAAARANAAPAVPANPNPTVDELQKAAEAAAAFEALKATAPATETAAAVLDRVASTQAAPVQRYVEPPAPPRVEAVDPTLRVDPGSMFVLDLSAQETERVHELIVNGTIRKFKFQPRIPNPLPRSIAVRFLKSEGFQLTDAQGNPLQWSKTPRQPHEMGAGEQISLGENEVIASYEELNIGSLRKRALQFGAPEAAMDWPKDTLVDFIKGKTLEMKRQRRNGRPGPDEDLDLEEFVPDPGMLGDSGPAYTL